MAGIPIGLELFSVREAFQEDPRATLKAVAGIGYQGVEFAGPPVASGAELRAMLRRSGVTALFGPSGSGKSTILGLVAGTLRPRQGRILLGDRTLVDTAAGIFKPPERRLVGVVFQDHLLFPHLTVRQNLLFGHGRRSGRPVDFNRVVEVLEVGPLLDREPDALSGGLDVVADAAIGQFARLRVEGDAANEVLLFRLGVPDDQDALVGDADRGPVGKGRRTRRRRSPGSPCGAARSRSTRRRRRR